MAQAYFNPKLFQFLEQLRRNNRRPWFLKHRAEFEELVRQPGLRFITDLQLRLREVSTWLVADPKPNGGSLFRIYRDVRFSKDKSPYKTHVGMNFWHASATEAVHGPGLYLHLEPKRVFFGGRDLATGCAVAGANPRCDCVEAGRVARGETRASIGWRHFDASAARV
jgi:uncharacterized protein (TIGR02453 family)